MIDTIGTDEANATANGAAMQGGRSAYDAATKAVALTPDRAPAVAALGEVYYRQGRLGDSEELFLKPLWKCNLDARAFLDLTHIWRVSLNLKRARDNTRSGAQTRSGGPRHPAGLSATLSGAGIIERRSGRAGVKRL
ncbi:MAG TPA: hypothetical protein VK703_01385 [Candidatus Acidoferrales bacterium]|nr:hypothetical protein [Candidatus Acidoferrales bacterium]